MVLLFWFLSLSIFVSNTGFDLRAYTQSEHATKQYEGALLTLKKPAVTTNSTVLALHKCEVNSSLLCDNNNIPFVNYGYIKGLDLGLKRNPVTVANLALEFLLKYRTHKDIHSLQAFLNNSKWLANAAIPSGNRSFSTYQYNYPWPPYHLDPPWRSALAQARGMNVLSNAYNLTGNSTYLKIAKSLLNAFFVPVEKGGVTYIRGMNGTGGYWYEEFVDNNTTSLNNGTGPRVLNGMGLALLDIYGFHNFTKDPAAKFLFNQGLKALRTDLPEYNHSLNYSSYDRFGLFAPIGYHDLHIQILRDLYRITNDTELLKYHDAWMKSSNISISEPIKTTSGVGLASNHNEQCTKITIRKTC